MKKFAIFIATDDGYLTYTNALLNSFLYHNLDCDFYIMHYDLENKEWLDNVTELRDDRIKLVNLGKHVSKISKNLYFKKYRFSKIVELSKDYDAVSLLDCDMLITTKNFMNLFELVEGTNKLIGCNEKFKWTFDNRFKYSTTNQSIFEHSFTARKFHCSVPIVFDMKKWIHVFNFYNDISFNSYDQKSENECLPIGDMFCWNISVYKCRKENDVVLFPMNTMTQVHSTNVRDFLSIEKIDRNWYTEQGDEVYTIHGRISEQWLTTQKSELDRINKQTGITDKTILDRLTAKKIRNLNMIRQEFDFFSTYEVQV